MSYNVRAYRVFIATPGDVPKEREQILKAILQMNENYNQEIIFVPIMYEFLPPHGGKNPQNFINKYGLDTCDVLIALFWTKLGQGTLGEIQRHINAGKYMMGYKLDKNGKIPAEIIHDEQKLKDYQELEVFFKKANTREGNEFGLYKTVTSGKDLALQVNQDLIKIRPFLVELTDDLLDENTVESDWLCEIEDDNVLSEAIPKYKVNVSRNLVLKMADRGLDNLRSDIVWDTILKKFEGKNGNMNLARTLLGLAYRKKFNHILYIRGVKQLYSKVKWLFIGFMKKLYMINPDQFEIIFNAEWLTDASTKINLMRIKEIKQ